MLFFNKVAKVEAVEPRVLVPLKRSPSVASLEEKSDAASCVDVFESSAATKRPRAGSNDASSVRSLSPTHFESGSSSPVSTNPEVASPPKPYGPENRSPSPQPPPRIHRFWEQACKVFDERREDLERRNIEVLTDTARDLICEIEMAPKFESSAIDDNGFDAYPGSSAILALEVHKALLFIEDPSAEKIDAGVRERLVQTMWEASWARLTDYVVELYQYKDPTDLNVLERMNCDEALSFANRLYPWVVKYAPAAHAPEALEEVVSNACEVAAQNGDKFLVAEIMQFVDKCIAEA